MEESTRIGDSPIMCKVGKYSEHFQGWNYNISYK